MSELEIFYAAVEATPPAELLRLFDLNTVGALRVAQAVLPGMRARGRGRLLFVSSVAGRIVTPPVEIAPPGLETALLEPGAVSSGSVDDVTTYSCRTTPARW